MQDSSRSVHPASATHASVAAVGLAALVLALAIVRLARPLGGDVAYSALLTIGLTSAAVGLTDLLWRKAHRRPSTGLDFSIDNPSWSRTALKLAGLIGSMGFVGLLYCLFPEYHSAFYDPYFAILRIILPAWLALSIPYFYWLDRKMAAPRDGYWHMGKLVTLQWREVDGAIVKQHVLGWLVKGFFLPLAATYLSDGLTNFLSYDIDQLASFKSWYDFLFDTFYMMDVALASMGYLMSLRIVDAHFRSADATLLGWVVALACYEPFWSLVSQHYLAYQSEPDWSGWLSDWPLLSYFWGGAILTLTAIYVWATVAFGLRFSNLTNRGIITNGPYRWTKHPAYAAKNLSWWMIAAPFLGHDPLEILRNCLLLLSVNGVYFLRARTEERHLSRDPHYVRYAEWMEARGIFRFGRSWPVLRRLAYRKKEVVAAASPLSAGLDG